MRPCVLTLALLVGCVDVTRPLARRAVPAVSRERAQADADERLRRAALPRVPTAQRATSVRLVATDGATQHVLLGPLRVDLTRDVVSPADDVPTRTIAFARRAARGWVFVTDRDDVYVSPTFTGPLRALRSLGCEAPPAPSPRTDFLGIDPRGPVATPTPPAVIWGGDGRIAFSLRGVALWSDGATLHTVDAPGLRALLWRNEEHGAMIAAHGTLRTTHDGGATWRDVPLGDAAPLDLSSDGGALVVTTSEGRRTLRDDGTLAPTAPPLALRASPCATLLSVPASVHSLFERGYTRVDAARAECVTPPTEPASWEPPTVVVHLPRAGGPDQMESWVTPRGRPAPLGPPRTLTVVNTVGVPALVSATRPGDPSTGHPMTLAWRGEDERGAFSVRISITAPREIPVTASWRLVAATRAGLLVEAAAVADGTTPNADIDLTQCPPDLFWFSAAGERRLHVTPAGDEHPVGLALPDGGAVVLWRDEPRVHEDSCEGATVAAPPGESVVLHLDASGGVVARRNVFTSGARRPLIGLGQSGERWGAVVADGAALTLLPLDGGSVPFGAWSLGDTARACGATVGDRLHLLGGMTDEHDDDLAVTIGPQGDGPNFAEPRLLTLERAGGGACVRRVWGVQRLYDTADEDTGEDPGERFGAVRFTARGGRLVGPFDDGRRIANVSVTLSDRIGFMQDI